MNDTDKDIDIIYRKMLKSLSGEKRILMGLSMFEMVSQLMICGIMQKYSAKDLKKQIFLKMYNDSFSEGDKEKILILIGSGSAASK